MFGKTDTLASILHHIHQDIDSRRFLSERLTYRIYHHYCYLKGKLMELYDWSLSGNRAIESRRSSLEKQLDALKQEHRSERVSCWQDIAKLRQEQRTWLKQYSDQALKTRVLFPDFDQGKAARPKRG